MILFSLLFFTFILGQVGRMEVYPGVVVYFHDIIIFLILFTVFYQKKFWLLTWRNKLFKPLILVIAVCYLSLALNPLRLNVNELILSSLYAKRFMVYAFIYFAGAYYLQEKKITITFLNSGLLFIGIAISLLGFLQLLLYPNIRNLIYLGWDPHFGRLVSTFFDPNFTGIILVLMLLLVLYQVTEKKYLFDRNIIFLSGVFAFIALIFTYSRSSWLALILGSGFLLWKQKKTIWLLVLVFMISLAIFMVPKPTGEGGNLTRKSSTLARLANFQNYSVFVLQQPIFGYGFNTLKYFNKKYHLIDEEKININHAATGVDNSFLFILLTTGVVGFLGFIYFGKVLLLGSNVLVKSSLLAVLVHSLFQNSLFYPWVMLWFWLLYTSEEQRSLKFKKRNI